MNKNTIYFCFEIKKQPFPYNHVFYFYSCFTSSSLLKESIISFDVERQFDSIC